ncbi:MAG: TetR/AcrR family transcriptional regulator [Flavobacteriales bacterium]|jgi:AcrR family transcriptional regulator|nr:TetR/AcrR family transcriptional regulator [Flavobacteriales bacterium]
MIVILLFLRPKLLTMDRLSNLSINVNENVYLKNPNSSTLGKKIIGGSIELIEQLGFEEFTFKKLAKHITSTEASIYRYFESKHHVLIYLVHWYWGWQEYRLLLRLTNVDCPIQRLERAINVLTEEIKEDSTFSQINEVLLNRIVISESSKAYLNKAVDKDNELGYFLKYKDVVARVSSIILEINSAFKYPHMLVSTVIEGAHHQRFFAEHLPRLTDVVEGEDAVTTFYKELVIKEITK